MNDRQLGYLVLALLTGFILTCTGIILYNVLLPVETRVCAFDNSGHLKIDDPVCIRGMTSGHVVKIESKNSKAYVTFVSKTPFQIYRNYRLSIVDMGIMGDRIMMLDGGSADNPPVPSRDTLAGICVVGTSEAIGMMYKLRDAVDKFTTVSEVFLSGDRKRPSLTNQIKGFMRTIDSLSLTINTLVTDINTHYAGSVDSLNRLINMTGTLAASLYKTVPPQVQSLKNTTDTLEIKLKGLAQLVVQADTIVHQLKGPQALAFEELLTKLQTNISAIQEIIQGLDDEGLKFKIWPF